MAKASSSLFAAEREALRRHEVGRVVRTCVLLARLNLGVGHAIKCVVWLRNTLWHLQVAILIEQKIDVDNVILQSETTPQSGLQTALLP